MSAITLLPPRLSSRIAAGEVIDRPQAILRELLDNAIDAKGDEIQVTVDGGGIDRIKVKDNGSGIARDDVAVIASPHATSKIKTEEDLYKIQTLGFRLSDSEERHSIQSAQSQLSLSPHATEKREQSQPSR